MILPISKKVSGDLVRYFTPHWKTEHVIGTNRVHHVIFTHENLKVDVTTRSVTFPKEIVFVITSIIQGKEMYKSLTGKFSPEDEETLTKQAYERGVLTRFNYSVTNTDEQGERFLFFVNKYGVPSFISTKSEHIVLPGVQPNTSMADTVIDGEFIQGTFYARDIYFAKGKNVSKKPLTERLDILFKALMSLRLQVLRMRIYYVVEEDKVYEYPGKKLTQFKNIYEASKFVLEKYKGLLFVPVYSDTSTFRFSSNFKINKVPSIFFIDSKVFTLSKKVEEVRLKIDLKLFFETRETFEKLLISIHKNILPGGTFKGFIKDSTNSGKLFGSNFKKFVQVMEKWDFKFIEKTGDNFIFQRLN